MINIQLCVYRIVNKENGKFYIGRTNNMDFRWSGHKSKLNKKKHPCKPLQKDWDIYGSNCFYIELIENIHDGIDVCEIEKYWIEKYRGELLYNENASEKAKLRFSLLRGMKS